MKRFLIGLLVLALTLTPVLALADGGTSVGEVISKQSSLRESASTSAKRIVYVPNGVPFTILSESDGWYHAEYTDDKGKTYTGWISSYYVVENPQHLVMRASTALYASPSLTDKRVGTCSRYEKFTVIEETGSYYLVSFRNAAGFVSKKADYWTDEELAVMNNTPATGVLQQDAALYLDASTKTRVATAKQGETFQVVGNVNGYAIVLYKTAIAYISLNDIAY